MLAPIFEICSASTAVTDLIGTNPVRLFPFGEAPQGVQAPYVVWQNIGGSPENYLGTLPDADGYSVQMDVYGVDAADALNVAMAIRDTVEPVGYVTGWGNTNRDFNTGLYRYNFTVDLLVNR
jgi:hypothetical protein